MGSIRKPWGLEVLLYPDLGYTENMTLIVKGIRANFRKWVMGWGGGDESVGHPSPSLRCAMRFEYKENASNCRIHEFVSIFLTSHTIVALMVNTHQ